MLLVAAALDSELRAVRVAAGASRLAGEGSIHVAGDLALIRTGVGEARAERAAAAITEFRPTAVLHLGMAGGLRAGLSAGDVMIVTGVSQGVLRLDEQTDLPEVGAVDPEGVAALRRALAELPDRLAQGQLLTVDRFVHRADDKTAIGRARTYLACDMEAAPLFAAAERLGIPYFGVRAISDPHDEQMPPMVRGDGAGAAIRRAASWARRPQAPQEAWRAVRGMRRAASALDRAGPLSVEVLRNRA